MRIFLLCLALAGCAAAPAPAPLVEPGTAPASGPADTSALNAYRAREGLGAVTRDADLDREARNHAAWMAETGRVAHRGRYFRSVGSRLSAAGCRGGAENVAGGRFPSGVWQAWMESPGHRRNMLSPRMRHYGYGRVGGYHALILSPECR